MTIEQMQSYSSFYNVPLPNPLEIRFLHGYAYKPVQNILEWGWCGTFGRFTAFVVFPDGTKIWTYPYPSTFNPNTDY
ncbi:MAG: hypothetical protein DDT21_01866 [Syntrophomonadaceae bacterium]|nr:hypothetical protein [Bacillota bacterium]